MSNSLKDQLLGLGFKPAPKPERRDGANRGGGKPHGKGPKGSQGGHGGSGGGGQGKGARPPAGGAEGAGKGRPNRRGGRGGQGGKPRTQEEIDLAKAYAIRAQKEKQERIAAEQAKQEAARIRREARAKFDAIIEGQSVNVADAEHKRHFEYGGKIKRVYCTEDQLRQLNAGELWVAQQKGRYLLVPIALLAQAKAAFPEGVALEVDPDATAGEDPYADPKYQVPDDLIW